MNIFFIIFKCQNKKNHAAFIFSLTQSHLYVYVYMHVWMYIECIILSISVVAIRARPRRCREDYCVSLLAVVHSLSDPIKIASHVRSSL